MSETKELSRPVHLIVQYYRAATPERQAEIDTCLRENLLNPFLEKLHLLTEEKFDISGFPNPEKVCQTVIGERLTFERAFRYANDSSEQVIWTLANADIYFDETLRFISDVDFTNQIFALTRHNVMPDGSLEFMPLEYAHGSQDAWIFTTPVPVEKILSRFYLGIPGCDNRIAYEFVRAGYIITNPSLKIILRHIDLLRQIETSVRVEEYFDLTNDENISAGRVAPTPYLGEIYPTERLDLACSGESEMYIQVLRDFAEHVRYITELRSEVARLEQYIDDVIDGKDRVIQDRERQIRDLVTQIDTIRNSVSWKITSPLRNVFDKIIK
jgi:hypothetical protein